LLPTGFDLTPILVLIFAVVAGGVSSAHDDWIGYFKAFGVSAVATLIAAYVLVFIVSLVGIVAPPDLSLSGFGLNVVVFIIGHVGSSIVLYITRMSK